MIAFLLAATLNAPACANPSIVSTSVQSVANLGALDRYTVAIVVQNAGSLRQPSDLLQSVDVFQDHERVDRIGLQPLPPGQSQRVIYRFDRSAEAGAGSTELLFSLDLNGRSGDDVDCHAGNENAKLYV